MGVLVQAYIHYRLKRAGHSMVFGGPIMLQLGRLGVVVTGGVCARRREEVVRDGPGGRLGRVRAEHVLVWGGVVVLLAACRI